MAKLLELPTDCCIPLKHAVNCQGCQTVSSSRPTQCRLCGNNRVVRLEPILDGSPEPPAQGSRQVRHKDVVAVPLDLHSSPVFLLRIAPAADDRLQGGRLVAACS
jgi:hypothetical protein